MISRATLLVLLTLSVSIFVTAAPIVERTERGSWFRLRNPDTVAYYCWVDNAGDTVFNGILHPRQATPWFRQGPRTSWGCKG